MKVDVSDSLNQTTLTVTVQPTRVWLLKLRVWLGCWMIRAAAAVMGIGTIRFEHGER